MDVPRVLGSARLGFSLNDYGPYLDIKNMAKVVFLGNH